MNLLSLLAIVVVFSGCSLVPRAAIQKAPEVSFFAEHISTFDYHSHSEVATGINLTLSARVSVCVFVLYLSAVMETRRQ